MQTLTNLTDDQLAALYGQSDQVTQAAVLREAQRRDRKAAQSAKDKQRWMAVTTEWLNWAHAQFLAAEAACRGNLLSKAGEKAGLDPWELWKGPASRAYKYASEELQEFWDANPRLTVTEYRAQMRRVGVSC